MSVETSTRSQKKDKSTLGSGKQAQPHKIPQATAEQMRLAQLVSDSKDDDSKLSADVAQIIEVTGTNEETAMLALYDASNDPVRAIELILERGSTQDNGWETAGRKKNRGGSSITRGVDSFDEDFKDDEKKPESKWDRAESRGRGRGNRRGRSRNQDRSKLNDDNDKENDDGQERGKGRRGGRGRGRSGTGRGRGGGRPQGRGGAPRHFKNSARHSGTEGFGSFNSKDSPTEPVEVWKGPDTECWDIEVGTWSSEDIKKQQTDKTKPDDSYTETWGTESWNDDLSESRVFQAQNVQIPAPAPITDMGPSEATTNHLPNSTPQMGERIDIGALFKKSSSSALPSQPGSNLVSNYGNPTNIYGSSQQQAGPQHTTPDVIQQLHQQGQSNSLFSESKSSGATVTSRLFGGYDRPQQQSTNAQSLFDSSQTQSSVDNSYSQFNGKLTHNQQQNTASSSFLDSFSGLKSQDPHQQQSAGLLGQLTDLPSKQSALSSYSQVRQQSSIGKQGVSGFTQGQQQQATDAVKASLGIPIGESSQQRQGPPGLPSQPPQSGNEIGPQDQGKDEPHLSFGSPLPPALNQQNKQLRRKMPALNSKIPASAVEMPGSNAYNSQEYVNFSLQFGADDSTSPLEPTLPAPDYGVKISQNGQSGGMPQQNSLFLNNDVVNTNAVNNRLSAAASESSLFSQSQQINSKEDDLTDSVAVSQRHSSQRLGDTVMASSSVDQSSRAGPPGLTLPNPASSALATLTAAGSALGSSRLGSERSSYSGQSDPLSGNHSLETSMNQSSSLSSNFPPPVHSYYSGSPLGTLEQSAQPSRQMQNDLSGASSRSLRSPVPSSSLPGSLQSSPMPHSKLLHTSGNTPAKDQNSSIGTSTSLASSISSLATSLSQSSIQTSQHHHHGNGLLNQSSMLPTPLSATTSASPYSVSSLSASGNRVLQDSTSVSSMGYSPQETMSSYSSSYSSTSSSSIYNNSVSSSGHAQSPQTLQQSQTPVPTSTTSYNSQSTLLTSSSSLGGFSSAKTAHQSNKNHPNLPQGVTTPILQNQYGIPIPGIMPYAPEMTAYGYDQLLLAQSRVMNPLNYYDMHFHNNTQSAALNNRDSSSLGPTTTGQGKFGRGEPSSPTPSATQLSLSGSMGSTLSQHNVSATQQSAQLKGSQTAGHHSQQQYVGAMPAYAAGYSSLAPQYYGLGMANTASFQYPPTMFAAAMHQPAPKHSVNTTAGFQQPNAGYSHSYSSAAITSSASGIPDLQGSNYSKTHASTFEKQQGYHQHANTPPPFNLQALTAAVAAGGGAGTGGGAPGLSPYATAPYMTMLQPHQATQQQAIHLLQQQHQDASAGQTVGSQRSLGSSSMTKSSSKQNAYGSASSGYWGN